MSPQAGVAPVGFEYVVMIVAHTGNVVGNKVPEQFLSLLEKLGRQNRSIGAELG